MNILYASNNKFISIMLTSIVSLLENTEQKISLYIIDDDISEKNKCQRACKDEPAILYC